MIPWTSRLSHPIRQKFTHSFMITTATNKSHYSFHQRSCVAGKLRAPYITRTVMIYLAMNLLWSSQSALNDSYLNHPEAHISPISLSGFLGRSKEEKKFSRPPVTWAAYYPLVSSWTHRTNMAANPKPYSKVLSKMSKYWKALACCDGILYNGIPGILRSLSTHPNTAQPGIINHRIGNPPHLYPPKRR